MATGLQGEADPANGVLLRDLTQLVACRVLDDEAFANVAAEFDARPGRVRDAIAHSQRDFRALFERLIAGAVEVGDLPADVDAPQLTFELKALGSSANSEFLLYDEPAAYQRARTAMLDRLRALATDPTLLSLPP